MLRRIFVFGSVAIAGACAAMAPMGCSDSGTGAPDAEPFPDVYVPEAGSEGGFDAAAPDAAPEAASNVSCGNVCDALIAFCFSGDSQYTSRDACMAQCMGLPLGATTDMADTVGCRQENAQSARAIAEPGCNAGGPFGGGVCGDRCADYCRIVVATCSGTHVVYASTSACMAECGSAYKFDNDAGAEYTTSGNTLNCREGLLLPLLSDLSGGTAATVCAALKSPSTGCHN
jgi:hypothetical protein